jgi:predicted Ser/Thr protein kinase
MNATDGLSAGTVLAGRYRVERALGRGGMGAVYLVRHVRTEERLALKLIHASISGNPELVERFRREARAPAQIDSDHVVRVLDADVAPEIGGAPFLVMEFLRGRDLEQELKARGRLAPAEVVSHLQQAARALDKAHRMGIVHRDLKPENLFLSERDDAGVVLKVLDFGIAKLTGDASHETATGSMLGTPLYMSPEQAQGTRGVVGPATDVWALGLIAFRLLTGEIYWRFESGPDLILKIVAAPMPAPSALVPWLGPYFDAWFARCCARPPEQRFTSAGEAIQTLATVFGLSAPASGEPVRALPVPSNASAGGMVGPPPGVAATAPPYGVTGPPPVSSGVSKQRLVLAIAGGGGLLTLILLVVLVVSLLPPRNTDTDTQPVEARRRQTPAADPTPTPSSAPPPPAPSAPTPPPVDACKAACARLARCTSIPDPSCEASCADSPGFASCIKSKDGCPGVAACAISTYCGGRGPVGIKSCKKTAECEGKCVWAGGDNKACMCSCMREMAPAHSNFLLMNNECGTVHCPDVCGNPMNGAACMLCFEGKCKSESEMCKQH